jgi:hypothetical protein
MKLSSFVMLSSRDAKLSSFAAAELSLVVVVVAVVEQSLVVAVTELSLVVVATKLAAVVVVATKVVAIVVAVTKVIAIVVAATKVDALVVTVKEVATVEVTSLNRKFQSLPRQTQCPACTIGRDNQCSFHVSIHHSLQSIPPCFYGGQVLPCPQVL